MVFSYHNVYNRPPTESDNAPLGAIWIDTLNESMYVKGSTWWLVKTKDK